MARITWQNVDAPNVSSSIEGMKVASDLLGRGLGAARQGITDVVDAKTLSASNAAMAQLLQFQKPEDVQAAVAAGQVAPGVDPRYLNKDAMAMMAGRANDLMAQETGQIKLGQTRQSNTDYQLLNSPEGRVAVNELRMAENSRDPALIAAAREKHSGFLLQASPDAMNALTTEGQRIGQTDQSYKVAETAFNHGESDRDVVQGSQSLYNETIGEAGGPEYAESYLRQNRDALIQKYGGGERGNRIYDNTLRTFMGSPGNDATSANAAMGSTIGGGSSMGAGGKPTHDVLLGDGRGKGGGNAYGIVAPKPISSMTMGELYNFQRNEMIPKTRAAGVGKIDGRVVGSSAAGTFQIVSDTLAEAAPKVFPGQDWRTIQFTPENQEKIARYLFNRLPVGADIHNTWEGIKAGTKKTAGMDWNTIRGQIIQKESGGSPRSVLADPRASAIATQTAIKHSIAENEVIPLAVDLEAAWNNFGTADSVAKNLTGKGQAFEGETSDAILAQISKVQETYGIKNSAVAGQILARAKDGRQSKIYDWQDSINPFADGMKSSIDWKKVESLAGFAKDRGAISKLAVNTDRQQQAMTKVSAGQTAVDALTQQMQAAMSNAQANGRSTAGIETRYNSLLRDAINRRDGAVQGSVASAMAGDNPDVRPRTPTAAPARRSAPAAAAAKPAAPQTVFKPTELDQNQINQGLAQGRFADIPRKSNEDDKTYAARVLTAKAVPARAKPILRKINPVEAAMLEELRNTARGGGFGGS